MKKIFKKTAAITVMSLALFINAASAEEAEIESPKRAIGARLSFGSNGNSTLGGADAAYHSLALYGINYTYYYSDFISFELSADSYETDFDLKVGSRSEPYGTLKQTFFHLTARVEEPTLTEDLRLYVGGGLGYYLNDLNRDKVTGSAINNFFALNTEVLQIDNSIGGHGVLGVEYNITKDLLLNVDVKLTFSKAAALIKHPNSVTEETDISINSIIFGAGIKYYF